MAVISGIFGLVVLAIGIVNTFWGNDPFFGIFICLLSLLYFPQTGQMLRKWFGFSIPLFLKILVGLFVIWAALGVGELFDKVDLMLKDLNLG
ncbi:MAG: hypothetical protein MUE58_06335 [Chitinophagaceae bacterium]|nr:hypothetical protein [Chitinophagaceae bacterium]